MLIDFLPRADAEHAQSINAISNELYEHSDPNPNPNPNPNPITLTLTLTLTLTILTEWYAKPRARQERIPSTRSTTYEVTSTTRVPPASRITGHAPTRSHLCISAVAEARGTCSSAKGSSS